MSDNAAGDDADFDKEAEREKLREKFARDEEKRESTRRMSELLLKGATMTNDHCDACGSPIFRQNGREFCPQCDTADASADSAADAGSAATGEADPEAAASDPNTAASDPNAVASDPNAVASDTDAAAEPATRQVPEQSTNGAGVGAAESNAVRRRAPADPAPAGTERTAADPTPAAGSERSADAAGGDLAAARDALVTALRRHAEAGAEETDPRTAADHLDAAREAAEALSALRR